MAASVMHGILCGMRLLIWSPRNSLVGLSPRSRPRKAAWDKGPDSLSEKKWKHSSWKNLAWSRSDSTKDTDSSWAQRDSTGDCERFWATSGRRGGGDGSCLGLCQEGWWGGALVTASGEAPGSHWSRVWVDTIPAGFRPWVGRQREGNELSQTHQESSQLWLSPGTRGLARRARCHKVSVWVIISKSTPNLA